MELEYLRALTIFHATCDHRSDFEQINKWAKETVEKYGFKYEWPKEWL